MRNSKFFFTPELTGYSLIFVEYWAALESNKLKLSVNRMENCFSETVVVILSETNMVSKSTLDILPMLFVMKSKYAFKFTISLAI